MAQHSIQHVEVQSECKLSNECESVLKTPNQGLSGTNELFELQNRLAVPEMQNVINWSAENENIILQPVMADGPTENLQLHYRKYNNLRSSTIRTRKQQAVCVRNAYKYYGSKKDPTVILDGLNMTVPKGVIYGLLGASGCGKTTLLSSIVGRKRLNSGEIWVLGGTPGSKGSGVPGPRIGYMPQDTALYGEFTIRETLVYFGWIAGMTSEKIQERMEFLIKLLMLSKADERVKDLSGGQRRRVSLAASLVHEPELLILDEPTVGLDPVLRETIWNHFLDITKEGHTTVIITTHYIDETRQAHLIALMRGGYFLAEESPDQLLRQFGLNVLEDVFLKLSMKQNTGNCQRSAISQQSTPTIVECTDHLETVNARHESNGVINETFVSDETDLRGKLEENSSLERHFNKHNTNPLKNKPISKSTGYFLVCNINHMRALLWKNFLWIMRNIPIMLVMLLLPFVQSVLFCVCIGNDPVNLTAAVVNYETNNVLKCQEPLSCNASQLSCTYLQYLERRGLILESYDDEVVARESVVMGKSYASIVVRHNYSTALRERIDQWQEAMSWDIISSEIDVFRDVSNKLIANHLKVLMYETFQDFLQDYMVTCDMNSRWITVPIKWGDPVYGEDIPSFTEFMAPGLLITFTSFLAVGLTAITMLTERTEGSLERSLVIGISGIELLISHTICQFIVMVLQSFITMISLFALFNITVKGSFVLVVVLTLLTGFCGMCYGFVISCVCTTVTTAFFIAMGSFLPMVILGGILWPIEGMHSLLQFLVYVFPLTQITESLRSVMQRGWDFSAEVVYMGVVIISVWIAIFLTISVLVLKFKKD